MGKSLYNNSLYYIAYRTINLVYPLITATYVSRVLKPEGVGQVSVAQTIVIFLAACALLGIPNYGTREVSKSKNRVKDSELFTELFITNALSTLVLSICYYTVINSVQYFSDKTQLYNIFGLILVLNIVNVDWFYYGKEEFKYITIRSGIVKSLSIVAIFMFVKDNSDVNTYALIFVLAYVGNYLFNIINLRKFVSLTFKGINPKKNLKYIIILAITYISNEIYVTIDTVMLGLIVGDTSAGYYSIAMKLTKIVINICTAMGTILLPRLSNVYHSGDYRMFNSILTKSVKVLIWFTVACVAGIWMTADYLIPVLFGTDFYPSVSILRILSLLVLFRSFSNLFLQVCLCVNEDSKTTTLYFTGMVLNVIINTIVIPRYNGNGAALASVISELYILIGLWRVTHKYMKIEIKHSFYVRVFASLSIMLIGLALVNLLGMHIFLQLIIDVFFGAIVYLTVSVLTKNDATIMLLNKLR